MFEVFYSNSVIPPGSLCVIKTSDLQHVADSRAPPPMILGVKAKHFGFAWDFIVLAEATQSLLTKLLIKCKNQRRSFPSSRWRSHTDSQVLAGLWTLQFM